ncbi:MAG: aconitate hydratase, partial [Alphaproteobacteria bacterium]|nr:aconitate hydratase [Alphaproteobacteria bacterium]
MFPQILLARTTFFFHKRQYLSNSPLPKRAIVRTRDMAISEPLAAGATELAAIFADVQLPAGRAPLCIRAIVENSLARFGNAAILRTALSAWRDGTAGPAIPLAPNRILMQDTAGVATLADLAAYRERVAPGAARHRDIPIDLVVDHSLSVEVSGSVDAAAINLRLELKRSAERNAFFQWMERALPGLRVYPPGSGICHQVNLEHLATIVDPVAAADGLKVGEFVIGTDSHTTMINALGVLGWGVGGIEALAAALGEPLEIRLPKVMRVQIVGR